MSYLYYFYLEFMFVCFVIYCFFFFMQKTAYEMRISDWSSDVCSSDLQGITAHGHQLRCGRMVADELPGIIDLRPRGAMGRVGFKPRLQRLAAIHARLGQADAECRRLGKLACHGLGGGGLVRSHFRWVHRARCSVARMTSFSTVLWLMP